MVLFEYTDLKSGHNVALGRIALGLSHPGHIEVTLERIQRHCPTDDSSIIAHCIMISAMNNFLIDRHSYLLKQTWMR